jgi:ethanolamine kinase
MKSTRTLYSSEHTAKAATFLLTENVREDFLVPPRKHLSDLPPTGEARAHSLLASHNLAPPLLARFDNGLLYKYIEGTVTKPEDLRRPEVWRAVAQRLGEWHASLPISGLSSEHGTANVFANDGHNVDFSGGKADAAAVQPNPESLTPGKHTPNLWTVIQKWIFALPSNTEKERSQKAELQEELGWLVQKFGDTTGPNSTPLVFSHCDLLSGNVIIETLRAAELERHPIETTTNMYGAAPLTVNFIDYEYATPAPAAFDIANHFAEWGGFDCDFNVLPTRKQRKDFLEHYLRSYNSHLDRPFSQQELDELFEQVDEFRGVPGFYWGVWSLIQTLISQIDFDYASYAQVRLGEYWAWKEEQSGSREMSGAEKPLRERRWAQEN